jgi:subtilisin family serine protease
MKRLAKLVCAFTIAAGGIAGATAQVGVPGLPPLPPLPQLPPVTDPATGALRTAQSTARAEARKLRVRELLRTERETVESDPQGQPILRRQVGALSPTPEALERARAQGFTVLRTDSLDGLGMSLVVLQAPDRMSTRRALKELRKLDPEGSYDFNHLYLDGGVQVEAADLPAPAAPPVAAQPAGTATVRVGLIDSGVDSAHPALAGATIIRHGCEGAELPAMHGTAVASLLVGQAGEFKGVVPGATLYAADVFCGHGGGSISLLAVALDWMARERVPVVNISLVGAKSVLLTALVRAMSQRGHLLVAAVGNDGPSAPPLFPAAYPEVIGVTGVDAKEQVLPEACRGEQVDFAARGAELQAAQVGGGFGEVRGTSFATPIVAGLLASPLAAPDVTQAAAAIAGLASQAKDLGREGVDTTYGKGLVGGGD